MVLCRNTISKQEFAEAFLDLVGTVDDTAVDIPEVCKIKIKIKIKSAASTRFLTSERSKRRRS